MNKEASFYERLKGTASYIWREGTVYIILAALIVMFSIINPLFFSGKNIYNLITQSSYYIIAGMGIAFVMIGGGSIFPSVTKWRWFPQRPRSSCRATWPLTAETAPRGSSS